MVSLNDLKDKLISLRNRSSRSVIEALVLFLFQLHTGNSTKLISSIFQLDNEQSIILEDSNGSRNFSKQGDTFLFYGGFLDVVCSLEERKFKVLMLKFAGFWNLCMACENKSIDIDHKIDKKLLSK